MKVYPLVACLIATLTTTPSQNCLMTEDVEVEDIEDMETRDLITVPPELMTAEERTRYVNTAFDHASQGKLLTMVQGDNYFPPGTYQLITPVAVLNFTEPISGIIWVIPDRTVFSLKSPQTFNSPAAGTQIRFFPETSEHGVPVRANFPEVAGQITLYVPFGGTGMAIEVTAAAAFVRNLTLNGPINRAWVAAVGNTLAVSFNAFL